MSPMRWKGTLAVAVVALAVGGLWVGFGGLDGGDSGSADIDAGMQSGDVDADTGRRDADEPAVTSGDLPAEIPLFDPFISPTLSDIDLERLAEATATLDPDSVCPEAVAVDSLQDVAEVVRIAGGCLFVEYVSLDGRTIADVRKSLAADAEVHAVGAPVLEVWPDQTSSYSNDPQSGEQWHLPKMHAKELVGGLAGGSRRHGGRH